MTTVGNFFQLSFTTPLKDSQGVGIHSQNLEKFNVGVGEHNNHFLHIPQVRPPGYSDLGQPTPNSGPNTSLPDPEGPTGPARGNLFDASA